MFQAATESWQRCEFPTKSGDFGTREPSGSRQFGHSVGFGRPLWKRYDTPPPSAVLRRPCALHPGKRKRSWRRGSRAAILETMRWPSAIFSARWSRKTFQPKTLVKLAEIYERLRRLAEAAELADRALRLDGACASAMLLRARLDRQAGQFNEAESFFKVLFTFKNPSRPSVRRVGMNWVGFWTARGVMTKPWRLFSKPRRCYAPMPDPTSRNCKSSASVWRRCKPGSAPKCCSAGLIQPKCLPPPRRLALLGGHPRSGTPCWNRFWIRTQTSSRRKRQPSFHDDAYMPLTRGLPEKNPCFRFSKRRQPGRLQRSRADYFRSTEMFLGNPIGNRR